MFSEELAEVFFGDSSALRFQPAAFLPSPNLPLVVLATLVRAAVHGRIAALRLYHEGAGVRIKRRDWPASMALPDRWKGPLQPHELLSGRQAVHCGDDGE
jgi:hypothetical protein